MILSHHVHVRGKLNKAVLLFVKIKRELARLPASGLQPAFGTTAPSLARYLVTSARPSRSNPLTIKKVALSDDLFYCGE